MADSVNAFVKLSRIMERSLVGAVGFGAVSGESMRLTTESCEVGGVLGMSWFPPYSLMARIFVLKAWAAIRS